MENLPRKGGNMRIPNKIGIIDSTQSTDTRLRFEDWEGYDKGKQIVHLANVVNEILDFLYQHPSLANEIGSKVVREGEKVVHDHTWKMNMRLGTRGFFECRECGETQERYIPANLA